MPDDSADIQEEELRISQHSASVTSAAGSTSINDSDRSEGYDMVLPLKSASSATVEDRNNRRGRARKRSKKRKGERRGLRTKFEIESLYIEISELTKQNEVLKQIWENIQLESTSIHSRQSSNKSATTAPHDNNTQQKQEVPCTVRYSSDDDGVEGSSDLDMSNSDKVDGKRRVNGKYDTIEGEDEKARMEFNRLFLS